MCHSKCVAPLLAILVVLIAFSSRGLIGSSPGADAIPLLPAATLPLELTAVQPQIAALSPEVLSVQPPDKLRKLREERLAAAWEYAKLVKLRVTNREQGPEELLQATRLVSEAELDLCTSAKERLDVMEKILKDAKANEDFAVKLSNTGQGRESTALLAKTERMRTEIALEEAQAKASVKSSLAPAPTRDDMALAENQAAIKRAALHVAEAQKARTMAKLTRSKALVAESAALERQAALKLQRFEDLLNTKSVEDRVVDEQRLLRDAAKARCEAAEAHVTEWEGQVAVDQAQIEVARQEHTGAELRVNLLKERLRSSE